MLINPLSINLSYNCASDGATSNTKTTSSMTTTSASPPEGGSYAVAHHPNEPLAEHIGQWLIGEALASADDGHRCRVGRNTGGQIIESK